MKIASLQVGALEAIARCDTICGDEKTAREREYMIRETETRKDSSLVQFVVKKYTSEKGGRMGCYCLPLMRLWEGSIYTQIQGTKDNYARRKVGGEGNARKGKVCIGSLAGNIGNRNRCSNCT